MMTPKALGRKGKPCRISKATRGTVGATCRVRVRASHEKSPAITSRPSSHRYCVSRPSPHPRSSTGDTVALARRHDSQGVSHRASLAGEAEASLPLRRAAKRRSHSALGSCEWSVLDIDHTSMRPFLWRRGNAAREVCVPAHRRPLRQPGKQVCADTRRQEGSRSLRPSTLVARARYPGATWPRG